MPARDRYHDNVKNALVKDGWTITHDPLHLTFGKQHLFADLGAEKLIAATKGQSKIAVEIKSFLSESGIRDLEQAIGQFILYQNVLAEKEPDRLLFLAVPMHVIDNLFSDPLGKLLIRNDIVRLIGFDPDSEAILTWIPTNATATSS